MHDKPGYGCRRPRSGTSADCASRDCVGSGLRNHVARRDCTDCASSEAVRSVGDGPRRVEAAHVRLVAASPPSPYPAPNRWKRRMSGSWGPRSSPGAPQAGRTPGRNSDSRQCPEEAVPGWDRGAISTFRASGRGDFRGLFPLGENCCGRKYALARRRLDRLGFRRGDGRICRPEPGAPDEPPTDSGRRSVAIRGDPSRRRSTTVSSSSFRCERRRGSGRSEPSRRP